MADGVNYSGLAGSLAVHPYSDRRYGTPGLYDPQADFLERVKEAYSLGIKPPSSPDPEHMRAYQLRAWPLLEQQRVRTWTDNPELEKILTYRHKPLGI